MILALGIEGQVIRRNTITGWAGAAEWYEAPESESYFGEQP